MKWPFDMPKQKMVLTSRLVTEQRAPIVYVSHDAGDKIWQFHPHEELEVKEEDIILATLKSLYLSDESLGQLSDLPEGWHAWRETPEAAWQREEIAD